MPDCKGFERLEALLLIAHWQVPRLVHAFAKVLARFEVRHVLASQRDCFTGLRIAPHPRRTIVQREAAEPANLDSLAASQRFAHELENMLDRQLHIFGRQMLLAAGNRLDQFGFCHELGPSTQATASDSRGAGYCPESSEVIFSFSKSPSVVPVVDLAASVL